MTPLQSILNSDRAIFQTGREEGSPKGKLDGVHQFGVSPKTNANFALHHFIHLIAPRGMAGFVLANGSKSSNPSGEGDIRRGLRN